MNDWSVISGVLLAYAGQWMRGLKRLPDPLVYVIVGVLGLALFWFGGTVPAVPVRGFVQAGLMWLFTLRGIAGFAADVKAAPKSNTL